MMVVVGRAIELCSLDVLCCSGIWGGKVVSPFPVVHQKHVTQLWSIQGENIQRTALPLQLLPLFPRKLNAVKRCQFEGIFSWLLILSSPTCLPAETTPDLMPFIYHPVSWRIKMYYLDCFLSLSFSGDTSHLPLYPEVLDLVKEQEHFSIPDVGMSVYTILFSETHQYSDPLKVNIVC